jgi:hypothetical protein
LSDESADVDGDAISIPIPSGVVPALFIGSVNLTTLYSTAINTVVDAYLFCEHAVQDIRNIYYNQPTSLTSPPIRYPVPASAYGSIIWAPHKPNWTTGTGWPQQFVDFGGRRYTPCFIPTATSIAGQIREGQVVLAANIVGTESNGDGTGQYIDSPDLLIQHTLVNYLFTDYAVGSYAAVPFFPASSYTILDTTTFNAARSVGFTRLSGGYISGVLLGADGAQRTAFDVVRDFLQGSDCDMGVNRHGQIMLSREDTSATPVVSFTAQSDILDGEFNVWNDRKHYANAVDFQYARRYLPPTTPLPTPSVGVPLPKNAIRDFSPWVSSLAGVANALAVGSFGREVTYKLENFVTRSSSTAWNVSGAILSRLTGPSRDGPRMFRFTTGLQGLNREGVNVELGSVIQVEHPERIGEVATSPFIGRVLTMEVDPQRARVTLEGRILR